MIDKLNQIKDQCTDGATKARIDGLIEELKAADKKPEPQQMAAPTPTPAKPAVGTITSGNKP